MAEKFKFVLYISGHSNVSTLAHINLRKIFEDFLRDHYELKIVYIEEFPELAETAGILTIPTLVRETPLPVKKFIGVMNDQSKILTGLGIQISAGSN